MAFLFMESDLTSDPIWLRPTMSNVQTCPVWISITLVQGLWDILVRIFEIAPNLVQMLSTTYLIIFGWVPRWPPHGTAILRNTIWLLGLGFGPNFPGPKPDRPDPTRPGPTRARPTRPAGRARPESRPDFFLHFF